MNLRPPKFHKPQVNQACSANACMGGRRCALPPNPHPAAFLWPTSFAGTAHPHLKRLHLQLKRLKNTSHNKEKTKYLRTHCAPYYLTSSDTMTTVTDHSILLFSWQVTLGTWVPVARVLQEVVSPVPRPWTDLYGIFMDDRFVWWSLNPPLLFSWNSTGFHGSSFRLFHHNSLGSESRIVSTS